MKWSEKFARIIQSFEIAEDKTGEINTKLGEINLFLLRKALEKKMWCSIEHIRS